MEPLTTVQTWLYDNLPIGIAILDADLTYRYVNASYAATQGAAAPQLLDRPLDAGPKDWAELVQAMAESARATARPVERYDIPLTYPRQPALRRTWDITLLPIYREETLESYVFYLLDVTAREDAEQLRASETRLRSILSVAADSILVIDEDGRIIQANPAVSRMFGYAAEELIDMPVTTIMPPAYGEDHPRFLARYLHTGIPHIIGTVREVQGVHKDGAVFPCELSVAESREEAHRRIFVGVLRDITERKRIEEELGTFSRALEQSASIVMITDTQGRIEYVNPKFSEVTGYTRDEVLGRGSNLLKSGETPPEEYHRLWAIICAGGEWRGEFHNRKKSGELYWESALISPIRDATGAITHFLAIKEDVTERRRLRAELETARARLETILTTVPTPLFVINNDCTVFMANAAATMLYGEPMDADHLFNIPRLHPETRAPWPSEDWPILRALREGRAVTNVEQVIVLPDGHEMPVLVHAAPVIVDDRVIAAVGVTQDLTALKAADRAKDTFLAFITHELRSPLATIISWAELARDDATVREEALEIILRNAYAQQRIIGDLLDISRLLYGKLPLEREPLDAWTVARRAAEARQDILDARRQTLVFVPPDEPLPVLADPVRLEQIINNLLTNAGKFTPEGGAITVSGARDGSMARLSVHDTGYGIPPDQLPNLFERFQQLGRERISGGLGLGLAVVRGLVELHGGHVTAESPGINQGSTFTVRIPLRHETPPK
jgi:PAS domain S-box-containing protein